MVWERAEYGQGYSEEKFGFCIGDRVWWVGMYGMRQDPENYKRDKANEELCHEIVRRWNLGTTNSQGPE